MKKFLFILSLLLLFTPMLLWNTEDSPSEDSYRFSAGDFTLVAVSTENNPRTFADYLDLADSRRGFRVKSLNLEAGVAFIQDGHTEIILIEGAGWVLLLSCHSSSVNKPYQILQVKMEKNIITLEQLNYIKAVYSKPYSLYHCLLLLTDLLSFSR